MPVNLITPEEAARLKGVTPAAIYAAVKGGRLPYHRVLKRIGLREADVRVWEPRSYAGRPGSKSGRPKGLVMSASAKARISESQKRRWAERKQKVL